MCGRGGPITAAVDVAGDQFLRGRDRLYTKLEFTSLSGL